MMSIVKHRRSRHLGNTWPACACNPSTVQWCVQVSSLKHVQQLFQSYLLPQGYPESVAPEYTRYMAWRGCQYFFGGAISVFTTRSLLGALGVGGRRSGEAAAALNWVVKDGAGRLGRFLFARWYVHPWMCQPSRSAVLPHSIDCAWCVVTT